VAARKSPSTRLSIEDWLQAGYIVLAEQGVRALKVERLCRLLGVTRGSFYWHFEDIDGYRWPSSTRCHRGNGCPA